MTCMKIRKEYDMKKDWGIVQGGQGKNMQDVEDAGFWFACCMVTFAFIVLFALLSWWRESERGGQPEVRFVQPEAKY